MNLNFPDSAKSRFQYEIQYILKGIEIQRSRIFEQKNTVHDSGYYMILVRRLYRIIEEIAKHDPRVANLKGKHVELFKKIKIRDDFEHDVEVDFVKDNDLLICCGVIKNKSSGKFKIKTSVFASEDTINIVSGNLHWDLKKDHLNFINSISEFTKLYPFSPKVVIKKQTFKNLLDEKAKLEKEISYLKNENDVLKKEILEYKAGLLSADVLGISN